MGGLLTSLYYVLFAPSITPKILHQCVLLVYVVCSFSFYDALRTKWRGSDNLVERVYWASFIPKVLECSQALLVHSAPPLAKRCYARDNDGTLLSAQVCKFEKPADSPTVQLCVNATLGIRKLALFCSAFFGHTVGKFLHSPTNSHLLPSLDKLDAIFNHLPMKAWEMPVNLVPPSNGARRIMSVFVA